MTVPRVVLQIIPDTIPASMRSERRWVTWRSEQRDGHRTKVPYIANANSKRADATDPSTWRAFGEAIRAYEAGTCDGIGFVLGDGWIGFDQDGSLDLELVTLLNSYTEVSPSGNGLHAIARGNKPGTRCRIGKFELYDTARYFAMTGRRLNQFPAEVQERTTELATVYNTLFGPTEPDTTQPNFIRRADDALSDDDVIVRARNANDKFARLWAGDSSGYPSPSEADAALCSHLAFWTRKDPAQIDRLFRRSGLMREKWNREDYRTRTTDLAIAGCESVYQPDEPDLTAPDTAGTAAGASGITRDDFRAYMPEHTYLHIPSRSFWPASSVNAKVPPIKIGKKSIAATAWLDRHRSVEQMTWAPGMPMLIPDRLIADGGWIEHPGSTVFNLYRPARVESGAAHKAKPWLKHLIKVYPHDRTHIVKWLAYQVQQPGGKVNHALVLGAPQGVGKDTILEPIKTAVGPWNFADIGPAHLLGRFNGFVKSKILRISEARDLGDMNRFAFYDHLKTYCAAPPDVLRCDEKNIREYNVFNVCGVVITTNHRSNGIYLPADDRRHFVAWSDLTKDDFDASYWNTLWKWYDNGGRAHVAAYLAQYDLSDFDPKAPPPKTPAFWAIVDANRAPEDAELPDAIDALNNPSAVTINDIDKASSVEFGAWLRHKENARAIPHRFNEVGYTRVRNPDAKDGLWRKNRRRVVVYAKATLSVLEQITAARALADQPTLPAGEAGGERPVSDVSDVSDS